MMRKFLRIRLAFSLPFHRFLAEKLGDKAWFVQSEKHYYQHHQTYYNNIRMLGMEYPDLDYKKALPFLLMLSDSVKEVG